MILNLTIIQEQGVYKKGLLYDLSNLEQVLR